ncbi:MAG: hypothetical protein H6739_13095 [Alphaproteobacteria bacterium]|nr:hypothetical protein [Alphaproteobacteria bacterium]
MTHDPTPADLSGVWEEETTWGIPEDDDLIEDRYDCCMSLHALELKLSDSGAGTFRYGQVYSSNHGTDRIYGEGTVRLEGDRLVGAFTWGFDRGASQGMGYESEHADRMAGRRLPHFVVIQVDGRPWLESRDFLSDNDVEARFYKQHDPSMALEELDELAERARGEMEEGDG